MDVLFSDKRTACVCIIVISCELKKIYDKKIEDI